MMNTLVRIHNLNNRLRPALAASAPFGTLAPTGLADELFSSFFRPAGTPDPEIRLEVSEDEKAYRVQATLAGVKKDDIHLSVEKNEVTIEAEIKREVSAGESERVLHTERYYGKTSRSFVVGQDIDDTQVDAKFADGVLTLVLPKKQPTAAKRITIG